MTKRMLLASLGLPLVTLAIGACAGDGNTSATSTSTQPSPDVCEANGWTKRDLVSKGRFGHLRRDLAGDFTVPTHQGDWNYFEQFTGCESVLFVPDSFTVSPLDDQPLLERRADVRQLIETGPKNVHYFFVTTATEGGTGSFVEAMTGRIDAILGGQTEEDAAWWQSHLHVVTVKAERLDGWVNEAMVAAGPGFGIDRFQRVRGFGSLADVTRFSPELNAAGAWSWEDNLAYLNQEVAYYNFESDREDELEQTNWTTHYLFYDEEMTVTGRTHATVELPDSETMASFDTMLIDLTHRCDPTLIEFGNCDPWDAVQTLFPLRSRGSRYLRPRDGALHHDLPPRRPLVR